jgi:hypothetical protein
MSRPGDLDGLSHAELKGLVVKQWEEMVELQRMVVALRDEIARLKGGSGRPNIKPSGMEQATEPKPPGSSGDQRRGRGSTRSKLSTHEERTVKVAAPPRGSRFKGYTSFVVQDLVIRPHVAGKGYTTLANIERMRELCRVQAEARQIPTRRHDREAQEQGPARRPRRTSPHFNRRRSESGLCALDNRCAHMGFPLDRGSIEDGF